MTGNAEARRRRLVRALRELSKEERATLNRLKRDGRAMLRKSDFLWDRLLASAATLGSSRGWDGLIGNAANYRRVKFRTLQKIPRASLKKHLDGVLRAAKVRMPSIKATRLAQNYELVCALGGPQAASAAARGMPGPEAKMAFLELFAGVGPKYARNIWMDLYHPEFRDSIAVDLRIKSVSKRLGKSFRTYEEEETFYLDVAEDAGLEGWEADRALYWFRDEVLLRASL